MGSLMEKNLTGHLLACMRPIEVPLYALFLASCELWAAGKTNSHFGEVFGAIQTGAAAEVAALSKERAWTAQAEAQGFYPLAIEAGGTLNARFHEFLQLLAVASSPSPAERAAFMAFALQRIRAVSLKGTCAIILARPVSRTAPGGVHRRGALPLIQPKPRPRAAAFVSPPPRPQPRAAWAGAFPDAPPPWAPLAVPAPVGPPTHRAPQMPGLSRNGAPLPSPTPHVNTSERPPQPPFR